MIKSQNRRNPGFPYFFLLVDGRIRIRTNNDGSGSVRIRTDTGSPKTYGTVRIRVHNTASALQIFQNFYKYPDPSFTFRLTVKSANVVILFAQNNFFLYYL
jgi:hypothetical protein